MDDIRAVLPTTAWVGTPAYMAPEQGRRSGTVDHRSDIYSLGVTFYHAVTGRLPFEAKSPTQILLKHIKEIPVPPIEIAPELSP